MVRNDPKSDQHEILVKKGSGDVSRNGETVRLADWERATFKAKSEKMAKIKEIGPPTPISPANMIPLFLLAGLQTKDVQFTWTAMTNAAGYRLRISRNPYFSSTIVDRPVNVADVTVTGLAPGAYYWMVQSLDASGKQSVESEKSRFTILPKGKDAVAIDLEIDIEPARARDRGDWQDRDGRPCHGERAGSHVRDQRRQFSLLHATAAGGREHDYGHSAERAGRCEYQAAKGRDSVARVYRGARPFVCGREWEYPIE